MKKRINYAYRYSFKHGKGSGTWICQVTPDKARAELLKRFHYEIESIELIN